MHANDNYPIMLQFLEVCKEIILQNNAALQADLESLANKIGEN